MPTERKQDGVIVKAEKAFRDFFYALIASENHHRTLLLVLGASIPTVGFLVWWRIFETNQSPNNSNAFAVFSVFVSAFGTLLAAIVLFKLQEIKTPDAFL